MEQSTAQIAYGVVVDEESGVGMDRVEPSRKSSQIVVTQVSANIDSTINFSLPPSHPPSLPSTYNVVISCLLSNTSAGITVNSL